MRTHALSAYVDKVFAWALRRTGNRMEAEELAQLIMLEAVESLPSLRNEETFHAWLWGLASNVYKRWLYKVRQDRYYNISLADAEVLGDDGAIQSLMVEEERRQVAQSVALLSLQWRQMIIMHYYEGLSVKQIADRIGLAPGTVKWRLFEARRRVREEMQGMEQAFHGLVRPLRLMVSMAGEGDYPRIGPWPTSFVSRAIAQNVAAAAYEGAATVEEIGRKTGIPAFYVEEELRALVDHELMRKVGNRYLTDFLILRHEGFKAVHDVMSNVAEQIAEPFVASVLAARGEIQGIGYDFAGKSFSEQLWTLLPFAFRETAAGSHRALVPPPRRDGGRWFVYGWEQRDMQVCRVSQYMRGAHDGKALLTMYSLHGVFEYARPQPRKIDVEALYQVAKGELGSAGVPEVMQEPVAELIQRRWLRREGKKCCLNILYMQRPHYDGLRQVMTDILEGHSRELVAARDDILRVLERHVPRHLNEQLRFQADLMSTGMGAYIMRRAVSRGVLPPVQDPASAGAFLLER
ncbi:MAG: RNA polymerase sigma factor [Limnochordia bacterium]|jgi:RNA polymerase sigma factor (sigma-70 family)